MPGLGSWHPGPPLYPKTPKSRRACPPPLSPLSTQSASHSPCPPREQGFPISDSTSPSPWGSSTSKSGHVPYPFCRARALLEPHPLWFRTPPASFWLCLCLKRYPLTLEESWVGALDFEDPLSTQTQKYAYGLQTVS